jgi:hypothetical protein
MGQAPPEFNRCNLPALTGNMGLPSPVKTCSWCLGTGNDTIDKVRRSLNEVVIGPLHFFYDVGRELPYEKSAAAAGTGSGWLQGRVNGRREWRELVPKFIRVYKTMVAAVVLHSVF